MRRAVLTLAALALIGGCNKSPEGSKAAPRADTPSQSQTNTPGAAPNTAASRWCAATCIGWSRC